MFNINIPTRVGFQTPFTNITMDLSPPDFLKDQPVIIGGIEQESTYSDFQTEMDMLNCAFSAVMLEKLHVFPIYNFYRLKIFKISLIAGQIVKLWIAASVYIT